MNPETTGIDDGGTRVPTIWFEYPTDRDDIGDDDFFQAQALLRIVAWLAQGGVVEAGRRTILFDFVLHRAITQRELATRLDLTPARVSQLLTSMRDEIACFTEAGCSSGKGGI
jgi:hypothetical protein